MFPFVLASTDPAFAASVTICASYNVDYDDADMLPDAGDDYFYSNSSDKVARGARIRAVPLDGTANVRDFAEWNDGQARDPGCVVLSLDETKQYSIQTCTVAEVNGNTIKILDDDTSPDTYCEVASGYGAYIPPGPSDEIDIGTSALPQWNAAAALGHAMYRRNWGINGVTYRVYLDDPTPPANCGGGCAPSTDIWVTSGLADLRFGVVHEIAHAMAYALDESEKAEALYGADYENCFHVGDKHEMQQKDYTSAAFVEGFAHFFAAVAFNSTVELDCGFVYYEEQDYDLDGTVDSLDPHPLDCEFGPETFSGDDMTYYVHNYDYLAEFCDGDHYNRSTPLDMLRFWWDFMSEEAAVAFNDCTAIVDAANPNDWNAADGGFLITDDPAYRLYYAAHGHLADDNDWDDHLINGIGP